MLAQQAKEKIYSSTEVSEGDFSTVHYKITMLYLFMERYIEVNLPTAVTMTLAFFPVPTLFIGTHV